MKAELREDFKQKLFEALNDFFWGNGRPVDIDISDVEKMSYKDGEEEKIVEDLFCITIRNDAFTVPDEICVDPFHIKASAGSFAFEWYGAWSDVPDYATDVNAFINQLAKLLVISVANQMLAGMLDRSGRCVYFNFIADTVNAHRAIKEAADE